ncbi:hypothetical protein R2360_00350 [Mycobacteroides chelonae]|uniref:hypothetical protein n=1 Tax=unclassified Mycobacteroides TaxID=2618759 RepID=UPI00071409B0|nr:MULTISPECIES: hypothetical protein [unclassified Mycobacteroides]MEC4838126.1 hypothetical protein [Mycobacteroides chelonae]KRQ24067.1 hypothetical protein AOT86_14870 [Mycobacteroides sp. H072]KRQ34599.1 hypothetical protein AOT84_17490 [Mycobacteroides sp. H002]KRQ55902.1 hypothetical protein AOT85_00550 [Mycobacteroides sp. H054]KRQ70048.1 hypothetical protein AOT83_12150 [Mycobacteroides sp. H001]
MVNIAGRLIDWVADRLYDRLRSRLLTDLEPYRDTIDKVPKIVDQVTDLTPWTLDDKVLDNLASRIARMLPDLVSKFLGFKR